MKFLTGIADAIDQICFYEAVDILAGLVKRESTGLDILKDTV